MSTAPTYLLRIDCPDEKGLVYKITGVLYHHNLNVLRNDEFVDRSNGHFFMRTEFAGDCSTEEMMSTLREILPDSVTISLTTSQPKSVVLLATKEHHCLSDLLVRNAYQDLNLNVLAVIANHDVLRPLVEQFGVPFHHVPHEAVSRDEHETRVLDLIRGYQPEYLVLAKYMRILSAEFQRQYPNRIINIHHSFLPAFVGANPYRQAFERGVKIIGATAHFVNEHLDEGPILTQGVTPVSHSKTWQELAAAGRDVERLVLARALKLVFEDRVFVKDNKTVVFE